MNKAPPPETVARVTRWAILLFFAYALLSGSFHFGSKTTPVPHGSSGEKAASDKNTAKDCSQNNPLENFSLMAGVLIPTIMPTVHSEDVSQGQGQYATCGQHATLRYEYYQENGSLIYSDMKNDKPASMTIGDGTMLRGLEQGIVGMRPGGQRRIAFPPPLGFGHLKNADIIQDVNKYTIKAPDLHQSVILGNIKLLSLSPDLPVSSQPLRVIDRKFSSGTRAQCGDTLSLELTIWKLDGTKLFSTVDTAGPLILTLGQSKAPYGIEQAILGMAENAQREVIIPAAFTKPLGEPAPGGSLNALQKVSLPRETLLAELQIVHIGSELLDPTAPIVMPPPPAPPHPAPLPPSLSELNKQDHPKQAAKKKKDKQTEDDDGEEGDKKE